jgi:hypothetical protein
MSSASNVVVGVGCVKLLELMRDPVTTTSVRDVVVLDAESAALAAMAVKAMNAAQIGNLQLRFSICFPLSLGPLLRDLCLLYENYQ